MSSLYVPDSAILNSTRWVTRLSQRDLSLQIPVNFVTNPGVSITAACFANNRYEDFATGKCISNLILSGFRRFELDVFWDTSRSQWGLCPVELGGGTVEGDLTSSTTVATPLNTATTLSNAIITGRQATAGTETSTPVATTTLLANPSTTSTSQGQGQATGLEYENGTIIQAGPYLCSPSTDLNLVIGVLTAHMTTTATRINATISILTLNLHAAAPASDPLGSAQEPSDVDLPEGRSLLSSIIANNASLYLYTPSDLLDQRDDLNNSMGWFTVSPSTQPNPAFFDVDFSGSSVSTPNGWPSESYIVLERNRRLLVAFGRVDPQMENYNFSGDADIIFPNGYLQSEQNFTTMSDGNITSECFFNPEETLLAYANSSWALSSIASGVAAVAPSFQLEQVSALASNLTDCGISPILNFTLNNATADQSWEPYKAFAESTIWSWGLGQPANGSSTEDFNDQNCASMNATSGFWQATDCSESRYGACRVSRQPYEWQISTSDAPYDRIDQACDQNTSFDVPRTALENSYLLSAWRSYRYEHRDDDDLGPLLWLDFNDLDITTCWVVGRNSTCPYQDPDTAVRSIVVPVVGGVVVFVLTVLTICVKCAGNRQTAKRRKRRGDDGWDYEGVPQ